MKQIKRSMMDEDRLVNLAVLLVEREILVNLEDAVDKFHALDKNQRIMLS